MNVNIPIRRGVRSRGALGVDDWMNLKKEIAIIGDEQHPSALAIECRKTIPVLGRSRKMLFFLQRTGTDHHPPRYHIFGTQNTNTDVGTTLTLAHIKIL